MFKFGVLVYCWWEYNTVITFKKIIWYHLLNFRTYFQSQSWALLNLSYGSGCVVSSKDVYKGKLLIEQHICTGEL